MSSNPNPGRLYCRDLLPGDVAIVSTEFSKYREVDTYRSVPLPSGCHKHAVFLIINTNYYAEPTVLVNNKIITFKTKWLNDVIVHVRKGENLKIKIWKSEV